MAGGPGLRRVGPVRRPAGGVPQEYPVRGRPVLSVLALLVLAGAASRRSLRRPRHVQNCKIWVGRRPSSSLHRGRRGDRGEGPRVGVTKPKKATLAPGGWWARWRSSPSGPALWRLLGELQAEIAAYELDKLLGLDMCPVGREADWRRSRVAVMWCRPPRASRTSGASRRRQPRRSPAGTGS